MQAEDIIKVELKMHPKAAVIRTCYALAEEADFWLTEATDEMVNVNILRKNPKDDLVELKKKFSTSLIDFTLRETIEEKTKIIRETIVLAALSGLQGSKEA
jgi:His-Xaa-Ser system protein HxsD